MADKQFHQAKTKRDIKQKTVFSHLYYLTERSYDQRATVAL